MIPERYAHLIKQVGDCWLWSGCKQRLGYGVCRPPFPNHLKTGLAHRVVYEMTIGPIPLGKELDHLCRNRACVNPLHLEPVTHAENVRRGEPAKRTHCPQGHQYTADNIYWTNGSQRSCKECNREACRRYDFLKRRGRHGRTA